MASKDTAWKRGLSSRLRKIADTIDVEESLAHALTPELPAPPPLPVGADLDHPETRSRALDELITECYPTVAAKVLSLAHEGSQANSDDWIIVARLLYDAHMHRVGGPPELARLRALVATFANAIEAQARSSARLAGYHDTEHDNLSSIEGDEAGTLVWQHYLCPPARLARQAIHGETVGDWLSALGELWSVSKAMLDRLDDPVAFVGDPLRDISSGDDVEVDGSDDAPTVDPVAACDDPLVLRARIALARVEELALW